MDVEFTARQVKISKALREQAEEGLERITKFLGRSARASITFSAQRHLQIAELTVQARLQTIAAEGKADTLESALRKALEHAENQARKHRDRRMEGKRLPKEEKSPASPPVTRAKVTRGRVDAEEIEASGKPARAGKKRAAAAAFPTHRAVAEPHIVHGSDSIATKPMTVEEAVKEAESGDRDLLIFHNKAGDLFVLHRRRSGEMELIELP